MDGTGQVVVHHDNLQASFYFIEVEWKHEEEEPGTKKTATGYCVAD
jgi:hypothetical protein